MIGDWYDPIEKRWHRPRDTTPVPPAPEPPENDYVRAARLVREQNIWDALKSTAEASQQE